MKCPKCGFAISGKLLGQALGAKGGKRCLHTMTPEARRLRALNAVRAREQYRKEKREKQMRI